MSPQDPRAESGYTLARKILLTSIAGLVTFFSSTLLNNTPLADQLLLTAVVGGIAFLAQFLVDFEARLYSLEDQQNKNVRMARTLIEQGFARMNEATRIFNLLENSTLTPASLTQLIQRSEKVNHRSIPLIRELAEHEIERVSGFLKSLGDQTDVGYEGEDRDWLLGLAELCQKSISATSLATIDAGGAGFEGGLWKNDLGERYLALQRDATERGVIIRRIFVFDRPGFADDPDFIAIGQAQQEAGILIKLLNSNMVPGHLKNSVSDFVVFDDVVSYVTTPDGVTMNSTDKPATLNTRLILDDTRVKRLAARFEELWKVSQPIPQEPQAGSTSPDPANT